MLEFPWDLMRRAREFRVAATALAAAGHADLHPGLDQVLEQRASVAVVDERAGRHADDDVFALLAVAVIAHAGLSGLCVPMMMAGQVDERGKLRIGFEQDASAVAAVAAVGPALGDVLLPPEADAPVAAFAGPNADFSLVDEEHAGNAKTPKSQKVKTPKRQNQREDSRKRGRVRGGAGTCREYAIFTVADFFYPETSGNERKNEWTELTRLTG